ncbi:nuclear transport factor 2 family protein [Leptothoe sp. ISB3NOV94-8A]|nr:nuclear transport factor 2 family protein [Leptothoe sp. LEGE 181152]
MAKEHANVTLLKRLDEYLDNSNIAGASGLFSKEFVWHFFNSQLPDMQGDYLGVEGLQAFFEKLAVMTGGTFHVEPVAIIPIGDELVVTHVQDTMTLDGQSIKLDAVVVWRIVNGYIAEAWDIPAIHTIHAPEPPIATAA